MGFAPSDVSRMSLWEFSAAVDAYNRAHGGDTDAGLQADDLDALSRLLDGA